MSLQIQAQAERERRKRVDRIALLAPDSWREWLKATYPAYINAPFAERHRHFWEWVEGIRSGVRPRPFVAIWPRGGAKSSSAELAVVRVGAKGSRSYVWYVSGTQEKADKHVETIGAMLESESLERYHPRLASRKIGKYGSSKGWRRSRLRTASGLTADALGLDVGSRGAKVENQRPDLIIFDDVDERFDSLATTRKKIETITTSLLPAGSVDCGVLFIQNMIHPNSIAAQLVDRRAEMLADRVISGPYPAVEGLEYEQVDGKFVITAGRATWEGQNLEICQNQMITWGLTAFLQEAQHQVEAPPGGIWDHIEFRHVEWEAIPSIVRGCVWVDPAVTSTDQSDSQGIQADGIDADGIIYRFFSWEQVTSPEDALKRAILKAIELKFNHVGIETDQGGDTWQSVYWRVVDELRKEKPELKWFPMMVWDKAGAGYGPKMERNMQMLADYERGKIVHVNGTHMILERALKRFPLTKPYDLVDASFWSWNDLRNASVMGGIHV